MIALSDRNKFPVYATRAAFMAASGGIDAPPFNPAWPIKQWFDPAAVDGPNSYSIWNGSVAAPGLISLVLSGAEAKTVNLQGHPAYPAYVPAPTLARRVLHFNGSDIGAPQVVPANILSTLDQANQLAALVGAKVVDASTATPFFVYEWDAETRRPFALQYQGASADVSGGPFVGDLLIGMNANGVGAPGHWDMSNSKLTWVADTVDDGTGGHPTMEVPLAPLPGEVLVSIPTGIAFSGPFWEVPAPATPASAGAADPLSQDTNDFVHKIATAMGLK